MDLLMLCHLSRLVHVSGSTYDKHTMRITPSTQAFHRYKGKNLACFFIDQCPGKTHDDASQSLKERLSPTTAPTRTRSEAFVDGTEASSQTVEDGFEASVAPHAEASSTSIRRPVWSLTAPSVRLKMLWISAINSLAALPDSAIPAPKELISGTMQVSTRLPTAFKMRTVTLRRHVGRSGFLLARDSQFKKVFELWVSQCTTVKTSTKRCEFSVRTHSITWRFRPQDEAERDEWMRHINSFVSKSTTL